MITEKPPWGVFIKLLYCIVLYCIVYTGRIWDRSEIRPFSPVYSPIRPVRGSQIRLVP